MPFDPSRPFEVESSPTVAFDPSQPFEVETQPTTLVAKPSPTAEQDAFTEQFIGAGTQAPLDQALSALTAPVRAGTGLAKGIADILYKGVQGVGDIYGKASAAGSVPGYYKSLFGDVAQTGLEVVPRLAYELAQGGASGFQSPETIRQTSRSLNAISNPLQGVIAALLSPEAAPTQARAQQAFQEDIFNKALAEQGEQGIAEFAQQQAGIPSFGTANIDVARAAPLLVGAETTIPAAIRGGAKALTGSVAPIQRAVSRSLPATAEQSAMAALDVTAEEAARHIPIVNQRILEISKSAPKTASEALTRASQAEASLYQDALVADRAATKQGLAPRSDLIMADVEETLNNIPSLLPEERTALLNDARARYTDVSSPEKGRSLQQRLNKEFEAQYANDTFDRAAPTNEVKLAVRNSIAEQMDEINKAVTGLDASPYSDIGSLIEFKGNLRKTAQNIERAEARRKTGIGSTKSTNIPSTKVQAIYQTKKSLLSPFQKTQLEILDKNVSKIFTQGERAGKAAALDPAVQQALIEKYFAQPTPPPLPQAAAPVAALSFEQQIQDLIKTYPAKLRKDPALARLAARAELQGAPKP